jgi:hypothetical protein
MLKIKPLSFHCHTRSSKIMHNINVLIITNVLSIIVSTVVKGQFIMNIKIVIIAVISIFLGMSSTASAADEKGGKMLVMNLVGSGAMYESTVPDIDGDGADDGAICFDVDLINKKNGHLVGTATDCLSNITDVGAGKALVGTTYFYLPQGTLVTRGNTTVQPVTQGITTADGQLITHVTGAAGTDNAILEGTGRFKNSTGTVRLSGMVDMSAFTGIAGTPIAFDCLFVIILD